MIVYGYFPIVLSSRMLSRAAVWCRLRTSATWRWCRERGGAASGGCLCGVLRRCVTVFPFATFVQSRLHDGLPRWIKCDTTALWASCIALPLPLVKKTVWSSSTACYGPRASPNQTRSDHDCYLFCARNPAMRAQLARSWGVDSIALHCDSSDPAMFQMYQKCAPPLASACMSMPYRRVLQSAGSYWPSD